jgi:hypothetical protein
MNRQILLSVFLTSVLLLACDEPTDQCTEHIGAGRTAIVTAEDGSQVVVAADANGNITYDCGSRVDTV